MKKIILLILFPITLFGRNLPTEPIVPKGVIKIFNQRFGINRYEEIDLFFDDVPSTMNYAIYCGPLGRYDIQEKTVIISIVLLIVSYFIFTLLTQNRKSRTNGSN